MKHAILGLLIFCVTHSSQLWADIQVQGYLNQAAMENLASAPTCAPAATCPLGRIYWDTTANEPRIWDGSVWQEMLVGAAAVPDPLLLGDGTTTAPTYSFSSSTITGMWRSPNQLNFEVDDETCLTLNDSTQTATFNCGGAGNQAIEVGANNLAGDSFLKLNTNGTGSNDAYIYFGDTDPDVGRIFYDHSFDSLSFYAGNTLTLTMDSTAVTSEREHRFQDGSETDPSITFEADGSLGFLRRTIDTMGQSGSLVLDSNNIGQEDSGTETNPSIPLAGTSTQTLALIAQGMNTTSKYTPALVFGSDDSSLSCPTKGCALAAIVGEAEETYSSTATGDMSLTFLTKNNAAGNNNSYQKSMRLISSGDLRIANDYTFISDTDTGMSNPSPNNLSLSVGGSVAMTMDQFEIEANERIEGINGATNGASFTFQSDVNSGLYLVQSDRPAITTGGVQAANWQTSGVVVLFDSSTYANTVCASNTSGLVVLDNCSSSIRYKENVVDLPDADSSKIWDLRPVKYDWKNSGDTNYGFIAEEVHAVLPDLTYYHTESNGEANEADHQTTIKLDENGDPEIEGVHYQHMTALLLAEMKKLRARIETLEAAQP